MASHSRDSNPAPTRITGPPVTRSRSRTQPELLEQDAVPEQTENSPIEGSQPALITTTPTKNKNEGAKPTEKSVKEICDDSIAIKMGEVNNEIEAVKAATDNLPRISLLLEDLAARMGRMDEEHKSKSNAEHELIQGMKSLRKDVNFMLEKKSEASKRRQLTLQAGPADASEHTDEQVEQVAENRRPTTKTKRGKISASTRFPHPEGATSYYSRQPSHYKPPHRTRRTAIAADSSSEDDYNDEEYVTGTTQEEEVATQVVPFHARPVGPPHVGLRSIKPANKIFDKLMSYRPYRMKLAFDTRSSSQTSDVRTPIKNLLISLRKHSFNGEDPIRIFEFLSRFVMEADTLQMTEAQAFIALPTFLEDPAESQFRSNLSGGSRYGGVNCWPEAVQYFLRTYATPTAMRDALEGLRSIRQKDDEDEDSYKRRLNDAAHRCGNVQEEDERITFFIDGLLPTTRTVVARYRESQPRRSTTFEALTHFARAEGEAVRARAQSSRVAAQRQYYLLRPTGRQQQKPGQVLLLAPHDHNSEVSSHQESEVQPLYYLPTEGPPSTIATSDLPSTIEEGKNNVDKDLEGLFYADKDNRVRRRPQPVPYENRSQRVGWVDQGKRTIICHGCYVVGDHILPQCKLPIWKIEEAVANYEKLSEEQKSSVPDKAYQEAKQFIAFKKKNDSTDGGKEVDQVEPKN